MMEVECPKDEPKKVVVIPEVEVTKDEITVNPKEDGQTTDATQSVSPSVSLSAEAFEGLSIVIRNPYAISTGVVLASVAVFAYVRRAL